MVDVVPGSEADNKGFVSGDLIVEVGQREVRVPADVEAQIEAARQAGRRSALLLVRRDGAGRFIALSTEP